MSWRTPRAGIRSSICWHCSGRTASWIANLSLRISPTTAGPTSSIPSTPPGSGQVAQLAAEKAGWGKRSMGKGEGMGIAMHRSFLTYVATVVRVEVNGEGKLRIRQVDTALDAGTIVNRDTVRNQFEGAAVFGTSLALLRGDHGHGRRDRSVEFCRLPGLPHERGAGESQHSHRRKRSAAGGCGRARPAAIRSRPMQRDLCGHRQARARIAAIKRETGQLERNST